MVVLCLSAVPFHPPALQAPHPHIHLLSLWTTAPYCGTVAVAPPRSVGHGQLWEESQAGGLLTPKEAGTINGKPPAATGAPGGLTTLIIVAMSSSMGREGSGACWELIRKAGGPITAGPEGWGQEWMRKNGWLFSSFCEPCSPVHSPGSTCNSGDLTRWVSQLQKCDILAAEGRGGQRAALICKWRPLIQIWTGQYREHDYYLPALKHMH